MMIRLVHSNSPIPGLAFPLFPYQHPYVDNRSTLMLCVLSPLEVCHSIPAILDAIFFLVCLAAVGDKRFLKAS